MPPKSWRTSRSKGNVRMENQGQPSGVLVVNAGVKKIVINPVPTRYRICKRPEGGVLKCDRCGREDAGTVRGENGWELWWIFQGPHDLCADCVPKVEAICRGSRRIPRVEFLEEHESS
jgi:hypothetical protein